MSEKISTREYFGALSDVYSEQGPLAAIASPKLSYLGAISFVMGLIGLVLNFFK